jgi:hypothetical protein
MLKEDSMYRQGDVLVVPVTGIPDDATEGARDKGRIVLAYGEATGHAHAIADPEAEVLEARGSRYLRIGAKGASLTHEEHGPIALPPGSYRVVIQREYTPRESRPVAD